jgi:hypothetical protein
MQEGLTKNWNKKKRGVGVFGRYTVNGFWYEDQSGATGWHITAWPDHGPIHDYWVSGTTFYSMSIHYFYKMTNRTLIEIFDAIPNLEQEERDAVMQAITAWEKPAEEGPAERTERTPQ